jgi:transposase
VWRGSWACIGAWFGEAVRNASSGAAQEDKTSGGEDSRSGDELAFAYFEGVFRVLRYDNLSSAVKKILRGQQRELTAWFIAFRSHWQYQAEFCTPSEGHEKGGVEGEVGYFRRNHWVPVPVASDLAALNRQLLEDCRTDESRIVWGRTECVGARLLTEKEHLLPLAAASSPWPRSASRASTRRDPRRCGRTLTRCR